MKPKQIILLATTRPDDLREFTKALKGDPEVTVIAVSNDAEALEMTRRAQPALVVIDAAADETSGLALARQLLQVNAFIHTSVISGMNKVEFHERSEGLGILSRLPARPLGRDGRELLALLRSMAPPV